MDIHEIKNEMCEVCRRMDQKGYSAGFDGNVTVKIDDDRFLCTPSTVSKYSIQPDQIVVIDSAAMVVSGSGKCSSEALLHLEVYRRRSDVKAVVHCHPPHAGAFAVTGQPIPSGVIPSAIYMLGDVPTADYATPGGQALADSIVPHVDHADCILLANHGSVTYGNSLQMAWWRTDVLDAYCRILLLSKALGEPRTLLPEQVEEIRQMRPGR